MSLALPVEILDYILGFLQSDKATLKSCSQSHPILFQLVDRHLYTTVIIKSLSGSHELHNVLRDRPHVANYVRTLRVEFDSWNAKDFLEDISFILLKLSRLRRVELSNSRVISIRWRSLPKTFRLAFFACLQLPSMADVRTDYVAFPLSILSSCKHIENLSLRGWERDIISESGNVRLPTIDSLALHYSHNDLSTITSWIQSRQLSSLTFSGIHLGPFPQILICCSHSLTNLDIDIGRMYRSDYNFVKSNLPKHPDDTIPIPLSTLPNLQQLIIRAQLYTTRNIEFRSPIFAIAEILKPASSLKSLTLDFYFFIEFYHDHQHQHNMADVFCTALHSLVAQSASPIGPIHLRVDSSPLPGSISSSAIASMFAGYPDLMSYVNNGKLIVTAVHPDFP